LSEGISLSTILGEFKMTISHKAISAARQMKEDIYLRTGLAVVDSFDANGNPVLTIGTATSTNQGCTVRIKMVDTVQVDGLGNAQRVYTPHVVQLITETSLVAGVSYLTTSNLSRILFELTKHGIKVDIYMPAQGQAPTVANITATPAVSIDSLWHPLTSSM
jgi:hypothetical protein